jgi:putative ribosome biogenesis GTPase RsgA
VVASWLDPPLWTELVDRYLIRRSATGWRYMLCVNKVDLATDRAAVQEAVRPYRELGHPVSSPAR